MTTATFNAPAAARSSQGFVERFLATTAAWYHGQCQDTTDRYLAAAVDHDDLARRAADLAAQERRFALYVTVY